MSNAVDTDNMKECPTLLVNSCHLLINHDLNTLNENENHVFQRTFKVVYLGYAVLDRRYTQPMLPWLIAEIKRHGLGNEEEIFIEITQLSLKAVRCEDEHIVFEHKLQSVSKFSQSTLDSSCFTYMTKEVAGGPSAYHVFQAPNENSVLELFKTVREVSKELSSHNNLSAQAMKTASGVTLDRVVCNSRQYEVLYVGRIKVSGKRAHPNFIDEAVEKFRLFELEKSYKNKHSEKVTSNLFLRLSKSSGKNEVEKKISKEDFNFSNGGNNDLLISPINDICKLDVGFSNLNQYSLSSSQSMDLSSIKSSLHVPGSSLITHTQSLDTPGCVNIIHDLRDSNPSVVLRDRVRSCSGDFPSTKQTPLFVFNRSEKDDVRRPRAYTSPSPNESRQTNRTMLFLIGRMEICLIGTDKKQMLLNKTFSDISHCSQGLRYLDHFGFICRETTLTGADCYCGYIFRCQTGKVVDEMMQTLKQAFSQAHSCYQKQPTRTPQVLKVFTCDACPMHWFHKLCCDLEGMPSEEAHLIILEKLGTLPDNVKEEIIMKFQKMTYEDVQEQNEVLVMLLREMAEQKQLVHSHVSNTLKNEPTLLKEKSTKLDSLREKARKSLSSSLETFLKLTSRDESKDFSLFNNQPAVDHRHLSYKDYDTQSYREGSFDSDQISSEQLTPVSSRPRSSTFTSSREMHHSGKKHLRFEADEANPPIINMFLKSNNQSPLQMNATPIGSWRQAIFHRVQSPGHDQDLGHVLDNTAQSSENRTKRTKEELRALWKKAIFEQILLIRMEKENRKLQVNQDAVSHKRMKLNYEEVTPCIKSASDNWEKLLCNQISQENKMDKDKLIEIVKAGIPKSKRGEIWQYLAQNHINFWSYSKNNDEEIPYEELLKQLTSHQHSILIDIGRTFPNHPFFSQTLGAGQLSLFNLLKAYSLLDKEVGYCQGLSFVAGILLLHMPEDQAFSMMKYLMFDLGLRRQYKTDMVAFQIQMYQLSRLIHDSYRDLYDHLEKLDISPTLYAAPWFLTLFASQFPFGFVARLFDLIFLYGIEVVFKISLLLMGNYKDYIMSCDSFESCMNFLKSSLPSVDTLQMEIIFSQVFNLDISRQLHAYEVEYHVLVEEMVQTQFNNSAELQNVRSTNKALKAQNMELMEQLQVAYSRMHNLEASRASLKSTCSRLEMRVSALEDEKEVLMHSMRVMKNKLEKLEVARIGIPENEEHPPPFAVVYALAGSEREEDEKFQSFIKSFCQNKDRETKGVESRGNKIQDDIVEEDVFEDNLDSK